MDLSKLKSGLLHVIEGNNGKRVGVGELRVDLMARDCFNAIQGLETENAQLRVVITESDPNFFKRKCRVCGCDWNHPCNDHDCWVEDDLCSACARKPEGSEKG